MAKSRIVFLYYLFVSMMAFFAVRAAYWVASGIDIDKRFRVCALPGSQLILIWAMNLTVTLSLHLVVGYFYYTAEGEGPFGPPSKQNHPKDKPVRKRILPYLSNWAMFCSLLLSAAPLLRNCG